ncbi:MAG: A/G-specific adenine glycosylase [Desulfobacteraceae bacterium]|nr:A/G-specific adenine glycosylase [Desulfobacteraceae bacterium]
MTRPTSIDAEPPIIVPATRAALRRALAAWYEQVRRDLPWRRTQDPYAIWVSEVMLQQTQVKTVVPYYQRFLECFPTIGHLARVDLQAVLKLWEGLGYYSRARNLHRAARMVVETMGGRVPDQWPAFRSLPGVGDYIAAAVLSIAFGRPYGVVDGNVKRVLARLFTMEIPVNGAGSHKPFQAVADQLLDVESPGQHNQAVMELGAAVCAPRNPLCEGCPLSRFCQAFKAHTVVQYPRRSVRRAVGRQQWAAGVVIRNGRLLLTQRPAAGLLAGLWEFPGGPVQTGAAPDLACNRAIRDMVGLEVHVEGHLVSVRHAYTHFKLQLEIFLCSAPQGRVRLHGPAAFRWVTLAQLDQLPLHKAVHKALAAEGVSETLRRCVVG